MKKNLLIVIFVIPFTLFLFMGVKVGESFFAQNNPKPTSQEQDPFHLSNEKFLLVVFVDSMNAETTHLEGVWLANFRRTDAAILFFPLLPSQANHGANQDQKITSVFQLDAQNRPSAKFFNTLTARNVSWDGYLILDRTSLITLTDIVGGVDIGTGPKNGTQLFSKLSPHEVNRLLAQRNQAYFLIDLCQKTSNELQLLLASQMLGSLPNLVSVGEVPLMEWKQELLAMKTKGKIECSAPTITTK